MGKKEVACPIKGCSKKDSSSSSSSAAAAIKEKAVSISAGGVIKPSSANSAKKRTEKALGQFLSDVLPALKKEMSNRKKEPFSWENYASYFKPDSKYLATFILPLFKFLEKDEIICTRYGNFDNRHMVKTTAGFDRVMLLSRHCDPEDLTPDVQQYLSQRYGREWFKIPAKDGFRAKAAAASGHEGCFKVVLVGLFEDSFVDSVTGEVILTINPSLMYEPLRPPPPKKERKAKHSSSSSSSKSDKKGSPSKTDADDEADEEEGGGSSSSPLIMPGVGAQDVPLSLLKDEEE